MLGRLVLVYSRTSMMVFLPSSIVPSSPGFLYSMWFTLFPNMPGVHYPRSPSFPFSTVGGGLRD
jgi:hypothetical protein